MIKEQDVLDAIAECQGERNPDASTCRNLAAFYTILDHIREDESNNKVAQSDYIDEQPTYSRSSAPTLSYKSNSEFYNLVSNKTIDEILELFDEVMNTLKIVNPRLYASIIRKVE